MAKLQVIISMFCRGARELFTVISLLLVAQLSHSQYRLWYDIGDRADSFKLQTNFSSRQNCASYVNRLPALFAAKGYPFASVDSVRYDSSSAFCVLYIGAPVRHSFLQTDSIEPAILEAIGWERYNRKGVNHRQFADIRERIMGFMENNGYPFAIISVDSIKLINDSMYAILHLDKGPLYKIDSIRNFGTGTISSGFLQQYLGIPNGSIYRREKLRDVSRKIDELPFLQEKSPWNMTMLGTGSILNMYLDTRKSSEVNVLVGLLPANAQLADNKMLVTGEANINLKNELGGGETIGLNWQQIQVKSPRLDIMFQQPYLFGSPFGMNFNFNLLKKDSSYVNIGMLIGATYALSARQSGTVFLQRLATNLLTVDTNALKQSRRLPSEADVSSLNLGVAYEYFNTDYRFNPRKGNELSLHASAGTKTIRKNNVIVKLYDSNEPSFNFNSLYDTMQLRSYQFRFRLKAAHYFPLSRASTIRAAFNGGWFQSPNMFRNELFQVGGYKTLRGFDEESIFSSAYGIATAEYRYLIGRNSFLAAFADYGISGNKSQGLNLSNNFLGIGLGMAFETKAGIFNISYAAGKRDGASFNLRQSKIHLGYVNYF